jgi:hypothetical protein
LWSPTGGMRASILSMRPSGNDLIIGLETNSDDSETAFKRDSFLDGLLRDGKRITRDLELERSKTSPIFGSLRVVSIYSWYQPQKSPHQSNLKTCLFNSPGNSSNLPPSVSSRTSASSKTSATAVQSVPARLLIGRSYTNPTNFVILTPSSLICKSVRLPFLGCDSPSLVHSQYLEGSTVLSRA